MQTTYDPDKRKLLSGLSHGSIFFSPLFLTIGIPLGISFLSDDPVVKDSAKEAINYHLNVWVYTAIAGFLAFFWWTIVLLPIIWIAGALLLVVTWVLPAIAILKSLSDPSQVFRYPFIFRLL
ncbi:MAG: DUF4870 domain-containing protein [Thermosynechococcaceae cyanobacterium MS004]|nr:DUF4870 domain-containing protein [Thermosynechococcaceae cyanobacterium MS004]